MRRNGFGWILAIAVAAAPAGACAMSAPQPQGRCRVVHVEKLPAETGGADAICAVFEKAIAARAPNLRYDSMEVEVLSKAGLVATVIAGGKTLAKLNFSVVDRNLNPVSMERFAQSLAAEVAKNHRS